MGAMHPDLNRCIYMWSDDRRCRNPIETPGAAFCVYHRTSREKKQAREHAGATVNPASVAAEVLSGWLCKHRLDTAAHLNEAVNQLFFLMVANKISPRGADSLLRAARLLLKTVPLMKREIIYPISKEQEALGAQFLEHLRDRMAAAIQQENQPAPSDPPTVTANEEGESPAIPQCPAIGPVGAPEHSPALQCREVSTASAVDDPERSRRASSRAVSPARALTTASAIPQESLPRATQGAQRLRRPPRHLHHTARAG